MDNKKKLMIWIVNSCLFVAVIFMGVIQAGKGAEVSILENEMYALQETKHKLSEEILNTGSSYGESEKITSLGFNEPEKIVYIDSIETVASLLSK